MITLESIKAFVLSLLILLSAEDRSEKEIDLLLQLTNPTQDVVLTLLSLLLKYQHLGALQNVFPHLQAWDYISLSGTTENRLVEWVDHLHQHFVEPPRVEKARYVIPDSPGYSTKFKVEPEP